MSESREKQTILESTSNKGTRPRETEYRSVIHEDRGMSAGAIAALVIAAVAAAIVITMLILNNQQKATEQELADERAKAENAQQPAAQPTQQPPVVVVPQTQPTIVPVPMPAQPATTPVAPSNYDLESQINSKLLDDQDLRSVLVDVKVSGTTATLTGTVPTDALRTRAEKIARSVKGIRTVKNSIVVRPD